jgi:hypothetical protein
VHERGIGDDRNAVDRDAGRRRVDSLPQTGDLAVDLDPSGGDELLARAP